MKRLLLPLLGGILLALHAAPASAGGVSMSWGDYCSRNDGGRTNFTWACRSDTSRLVRMTCSFVPLRTHPDFVGLHVSLIGMTEASRVPDWWQFGEGGCREGALSLSMDGSAMAGGSAVCADPWGGLATGTLGAWEVAFGYLVRTSATCTLAEPVAIEAEREYFACQFRVDTRKTVSGECGTGCLVPWIFVTDYIELRFADGIAPEVLDEARADGYRCLQYQNSTLDDRGCYSELGMPVRNSTWGQIKSLYR